MIRRGDEGRTNRRTAAKLAAVALGMFGFGYALVPLYDVLCEVTGIGGRTGVVEAATFVEEEDETRVIKVDFVAHVNSALPWAFRPVVRSMEVHPGRVYEATFVARNDSVRETVGQAVPAVVPAAASLYFDKTECFCFTNQRFAPGEEREMPVRFVVRRDLPAEVRAVTLSYTFFDAASG